MSSMLKNLSAERCALIICLVCGALLSVALIMEHVMGLAPCPLCMMQRLWVFAVGLIAYISLLHNPRWGIYPLLGSLATLIGAGFSIRQLWLQGLPDDEKPACGAPLQYLLDGNQFSEALSAMTSGTGDCAQVSWSLLGVSIPGWVLLGFVTLLAANILQLRQGTR